MLRANEIKDATARLQASRAQAEPYQAPGSIEDQRAAGEAAGRRWALESASHNELCDLLDAGRAGTTSFAAGFNRAALDTAMSLFPLPPMASVEAPVEQPETPSDVANDQPESPVVE